MINTGWPAESRSMVICPTIGADDDDDAIVDAGRFGVGTHHNALKEYVDGLADFSVSRNAVSQNCDRVAFVELNT